MKYADLHLHTVYSDSTYEPLELILSAKEAGLDCIAVVDHDTVNGILPTINAGKPQGIEVIPGIELSCEYRGSEIHMLGYLIDYQDSVLMDRLAQIRKIRYERIYKMIDKLKAMNVDINPDDVFKLSRTDSVGRLHLARIIVKLGFAGSIPEVFQRFIGDKGPAYVCGFRLTPEEAIHLILKARGIPVLAHPYILNNDNVIPEFVKYGLRGLEVYYPEHTNVKTQGYKELAEKFNLLVTGGSDCHGKAKPEVAIGSVKIPYELVERLKEEKAKL